MTITRGILCLWQLRKWLLQILIVLLVSPLSVTGMAIVYRSKTITVLRYTAVMCMCQKPTFTACVVQSSSQNICFA